jgi:RNA polymerase sigma-70 factor (ECF subfamily)
MDEPLDSWFTREVMVHDEALTRYLQRSWPRADDIHDLRQETYVRIYEAAREQIPAIVRPFLFTIARRLMTDRIRRQRIVAIDSVGDLDALNVLVDDISPERDMAAHQELRQLAEALDALPPKCREVVWMRRIDELPQREVAERLGMSQKTVEWHMVKGMKRLIDAMLGDAETQDEHTAHAKSGDGHSKRGPKGRV